MTAIQEWSLERARCGLICPSLPDQPRTKGRINADPCGRPLYKWIYLPRPHPDKPYATAMCKEHWLMMGHCENFEYCARVRAGQVFDSKEELIAYAILNG